MSDNGSPIRNWNEYAPVANNVRLLIDGDDVQGFFIPEHAKQAWFQVITAIDPEGTKIAGGVYYAFAPNTEAGTNAFVSHTESVPPGWFPSRVVKLDRARGQRVSFMSTHPILRVWVQLTYWV